MKTKLIAGLVVLALVATAVVAVSARNNLGMQSSMKAQQWSRGPCGMNELTDDEKQEIQEKLQAFRQDLFEDYGIDLTDEEQIDEIRQAMQERRQEMQQQMQEYRQEQFEQYGIDLTDEEREEIRQQMQEYRQELLSEYGVSCPSGPLGAGEEGTGPRGHMMGLRMHGFRGGPGFGGFAAPTQDLVE
jgi:Skp family chaperone for outer membrane proteins